MNGAASLEGAHAVDPHVRVPTWEDHEVFTGNQRIQSERYDSGRNYGRNRAQVEQAVGVSRAFAHRVSNRDGKLAGAQRLTSALSKMGHRVKLMPAKFIKAFDIGNKNDPADARTIWMVTDAEQAVTVKTEG